MEGISDIRITGLDETRRPRILKEPYINLYFKISHKVPVEISSEFNRMLGRYQYPARINEDEGLFVETWVRTQEEIVPHLELLKKTIRQCVDGYINKLHAANTIKTANMQESAEQVRLNAVLESLKFD